MRKEAGFEVVDHIKIGYKGAGKCVEVLKGDKSICEGVLCDTLEEGLFDGYTKDLDINGESVTIAVKKV